MLDATEKAAEFPKVVHGKSEDGKPGRAFIVIQAGDTANTEALEARGGKTLREKDGLLIFGFPVGMATTEVEAILWDLQSSTEIPDPPAEVAVATGSQAPERPDAVDLASGAKAESLGWNFDMTAAPLGGERVITGQARGVTSFERTVHVPEKIFAAHKSGLVTISYWIPDETRWCMFTKDFPPVAWRAFEEGSALPKFSTE